MGLSEAFSRYIGLPIVDLARKTHAIDELKRLKLTEFDTIDELETLQMDRMRSLLRHCQQNVPYYRKLFEEHDFDASGFSAYEELERLPVLTKDDIRANFEDLKSAGFESFRPRIKETGGSTGQPLKMYHDDRSHSAMWANIYRGFGHAGYRPGDKYLTIASGSLVPKKLRTGMSMYFWLQNSLIIPGYFLERDYVRHILDVIRKRKPKFIYAYSSSLAAMAREISDMPGEIDCLKAIFTTADMLYPEQRKRIEQVLNAPVFDNYGCPEAGVMTWECEKHDGYHYNMESCYLEIVDPDDEGVGRIISTNLTNYAFPIIRYDTGDIARIDRIGRCECGRSHSKVTSLLGRQRDIVTLANGRMVHGAFFNHLPAFYNNEEINRYQIIQTDIESLEVHLDIDGTLDIAQFGFIKEQLEDALDRQVTVEILKDGFRVSKYSNKHRVVISDVDNKWT